MARAILDIRKTNYTGLDNETIAVVANVSEPLLSVLEKYIFFAEQKDVVDNFTREETFIMENYRKRIPKILQSVRNYELRYSGQLQLLMLFQVMHGCSKMILVCLWQGQYVDCTPNYFETRRTDNGFCCSFNTVDIGDQLFVQSFHFLVLGSSSV